MSCQAISRHRTSLSHSTLQKLLTTKQTPHVTPRHKARYFNTIPHSSKHPISGRTNPDARDSFPSIDCQQGRTLHNVSSLEASFPCYLSDVSVLPSRQIVVPVAPDVFRPPLRAHCFPTGFNYGIFVQPRNEQTIKLQLAPHASTSRCSRVVGYSRTRI